MRDRRAFGAGGPTLEEPFGLILYKIRNPMAFPLLHQHFAARAEPTQT
jgi:hypothetical protein